MSSPHAHAGVAEAAANPDARPAPGAYFALLVLFGMNLLNYVDRYVFYSVGELISRDLDFTDFWFGVLSSSFMVVYTLVSPLMGFVGDRYARTRLLAVGVGLWSVATVGTAFAGRATGHPFWEMFFWRALLGVGEASYGIIAPTLLADLFPQRLRGRVIGLFYLALPVGGALGYALGGLVSDRLGLGWRAPFLVVGVPGLAAAAAALLIRDPGRGAARRPALADYLAFFRNRTFLLNTLGLTAVTFATGAYAVWGSTFYQRAHDLEVHQANDRIGALTLVAGLVGISLGIALPDLLRRATRRADLFWAGTAATLAAPFALLGLVERDPTWSLVLVLVAMVLLASVLGPCNTVTANVVPANRRAAGFALSIFVIHALGDIASPPLIGWLSDLFGRAPWVDSSLSLALAAIGHGPTATEDGAKTNLTVGMLSVVPLLALGGVFFLLGARSLPADQEKARRESGDDGGDEAFAH